MNGELNGELRKNHRQKLGFVCRMRGRNLQTQANSQPQNKVNK